MMDQILKVPLTVSEDLSSGNKPLSFSKKGKQKVFKKIREKEEVSILKGLAKSLE